MAIAYDDYAPIANEKPRDPAAEAAAIQRYAAQVARQTTPARTRVADDAEEIE